MTLPQDRAAGTPADGAQEASSAPSTDESVPARDIDWPAAARIIPTRYPSVFLFDRVASPEDFDALYALEALTNDRLRDETGVLSLVPPEQRIYGPGTGPIMAAFTHLNPLGSRFSDGSYGVFYAARDRRTAVAETRYHHARFLRATQEGPLHLPMRLYQVRIHARLDDIRAHDIRALGADSAAWHDPDDLGPARSLGRRRREAGSAGIVYRSVRDPGGENVALFRPDAASRCQHAAYLLYAWDGERFTDVYEKTD